jgi:elongation factor 2
VHGDAKEFAKTLTDKYGWDPSEARKIWSFGPDDSGPNCFVDKTTGV